MTLRIKMGPEPTHNSIAFQKFCSSWSIIYKTGIPYNPTEQAIVKRTNRVSKLQILKLNPLKSTDYYAKHW